MYARGPHRAAGDRHGHKLNVLLYCLIYAASCLIAHSSSLLVLLVGRALAGVAYSLLFTAFESWAVAEVDAKARDASRTLACASRADSGAIRMLLDVFSKRNLCRPFFCVLILGTLAAVDRRRRGWGGRASRMSLAPRSLRARLRLSSQGLWVRPAPLCRRSKPPTAHRS